ncbi:MAG: hypothetical protein AAF483_17755 [Planctomycetota bacterium]
MSTWLQASRFPINLAVATLIAATSLNSVYAQSGTRTQGSTTKQGSTTVQGSSMRGSGTTTKSVAIAMDGYCPVCILEMKKWVKGNARFFVDVDNKRYLFPEEKQRQMFLSNVAKYVPALNGDCTVCLVDGKVRATGSVHHAAFRNGRLYLFPAADQKAKFMANPKKYENADLAFGGMCSVCRVEMQKEVAGKTDFGTVYKGKRYYFPGADQLKMFVAQPEKYAEPSN